MAPESAVGLSSGAPEDGAEEGGQPQRWAGDELAEWGPQAPWYQTVLPVVKGTELKETVNGLSEF